ncbi:unnamed protein product [Leptosia nina]|uniref:Uncharacterized protein n=1 Tax=Leptosia nina TaxID=320188 RepID=A0AAV1K783_9NEOP
MEQYLGVPSPPTSVLRYTASQSHSARRPVLTGFSTIWIYIVGCTGSVFTKEATPFLFVELQTSSYIINYEVTARRRFKQKGFGQQPKHYNCRFIKMGNCSRRCNDQR